MVKLPAGGARVARTLSDKRMLDMTAGTEFNDLFCLYEEQSRTVVSARCQIDKNHHLTFTFFHCVKVKSLHSLTFGYLLIMFIYFGDLLFFAHFPSSQLI